MLAMFGIGPMEMLVVGGLACGGALVAVIVVGMSIFRNSKQNSSSHDTEGFAENQPRRDDS